MTFPLYRRPGTVAFLDDDPAYLEEGEGASGIAGTDSRGINVTIKATQRQPTIYTGTINVTPI